MLNRKPIFINAFGRGGSNILMNLILSHPNVCLSSGETHKVFKGTKWDPRWRRIKRKVVYDFPIRLLAGQNMFNPRLLEKRKQVSDKLKNYIDHILYNGRFIAMIDSHNRFKYENVEYTREELADCRLLTKGLNGIVFTAEMFAEMYPDATFIALIRNGLAICEGYIRRGIKAEETAYTYKEVVEQMLEYDKTMHNYSVVFYEDMVKQPVKFMEDIYKKIGLDSKEVKNVRLQSKPIMDSKGDHVLPKGKDRQVFWYKPESLSSHIKPDINENQIKKLSPTDKEKFLSVAGDVMKKAGYAID